MKMGVRIPSGYQDLFDFSRRNRDKGKIVILDLKKGVFIG